MQTTAQTKRHVLVVDDEPSVANVMEMMLRFEGCEVQTTGSGEDGKLWTPNMTSTCGPIESSVREEGGGRGRAERWRG